MSTVFKLLTDAREIVKDIDRWTQGTSARDSAGQRVHPARKVATCFCTGGVIENLCQRDEYAGMFNRAANVLTAAANKMGHNDYVELNDNAARPKDEVHRQVIRMFDMAIVMEAVRS
jgi:hypothetical protein